MGCRKGRRAACLIEGKLGGTADHFSLKNKKGYGVCSFSMQMHWDALLERARKIHASRKERGLEGLHIYHRYRCLQDGAKEVEFLKDGRRIESSQRLA